MRTEHRSQEERILSYVPQQYPFRFIDSISELSKDHIVGHYTFDPALDFYQGHFPHQAVTPGTILIEAMAQTVVVALGLFLIECDNKDKSNIDPNDYITFFTDAEVEFFHPVPPGETVKICGEKLSWRFRKIRSKASLYLSNGVLAASGTLSGMGIKK
ncbi:MAG: beta-hydroxyacyl-ACP dehydratase [Proteobacteria bacterium]|nr:beta-hydroxyacyl-ACP dehydratase [Pseudomonadota bacterium]